ncbi:hypothetical protein V1477_001885 [Vespula maculifrons]|uniref:Uncharacterized protein n=2 Tax=Vespula TaxID=7451 RepID=A0A834KTZ7_VESVU|nr:hypothetical protein HZH66_000165 [Vespula vulgaris]
MAPWTSAEKIVPYRESLWCSDSRVSLIRRGTSLGPTLLEARFAVVPLHGVNVVSSNGENDDDGDGGSDDGCV